jgi:hypothetical protein
MLHIIKIPIWTCWNITFSGRSVSSSICPASALLLYHFGCATVFPPLLISYQLEFCNTLDNFIAKLQVRSLHGYVQFDDMHISTWCAPFEWLCKIVYSIPLGYANNCLFIWPMKSNKPVLQSNGIRLTIIQILVFSKCRSISSRYNTL